jgi:hypothetical protein
VLLRSVLMAEDMKDKVSWGWAGSTSGAPTTTATTAAGEKVLRLDLKKGNNADGREYHYLSQSQRDPQCLGEQPEQVLQALQDRLQDALAAEQKGMDSWSRGVEALRAELIISQRKNKKEKGKGSKRSGKEPFRIRFTATLSVSALEACQRKDESDEEEEAEEGKEGNKEEGDKAKRTYEEEFSFKQAASAFGMVLGNVALCERVKTVLQSWAERLRKANALPPGASQLKGKFWLREQELLRVFPDKVGVQYGQPELPL